MLIGKTISQLPNLSAVTSAVTIPVEISSTTYHMTVDSLSKAHPFLNISANFFSNPKVITENINIPENSNALMVGPITVEGIINIPATSNLYIITGI